MSREKRIAKFRHDCIESVVVNTCDDIHDTGNSLTGVSVRESAAYYLVRSSYYEGDLEDVAQELSSMSEVMAPTTQTSLPTKPSWRGAGARTTSRSRWWASSAR